MRTQITKNLPGMQAFCPASSQIEYGFNEAVTFSRGDSGPIRPPDPADKQKQLTSLKREKKSTTKTAGLALAELQPGFTDSLNMEITHRCIRATLTHTEGHKSQIILLMPPFNLPEEPFEMAYNFLHSIIQSLSIDWVSLHGYRMELGLMLADGSFKGGGKSNDYFAFFTPEGGSKIKQYCKANGIKL